MSDKRAAFINAVRNQVSIGLYSVRKCTGGNVVRYAEIGQNSIRCHEAMLYGLIRASANLTVLSR